MSARQRVPLTGRSNKADITSPIKTGKSPRVSARGNANSARSNPQNSARALPETTTPRSGRGSARNEPSAVLTSGNLAMLNNTRSSTGSVNDFIPRSSRSDTHMSELSVGEVMRRLREKSDASKNIADMRDIEALGEYNAFSRPRPSKTIPLRSVFLDPGVNNFQPSKTRSELMKKIRITSAPHPSYDLDLDGYVSQEDYKLAKRFDFDGNGVLDPDERAIGKRVLADEFFKVHEEQGDLGCFGQKFTENTHKKNVDNLANAYSFERAYERLLSVERTLKAGNSAPILDCMRLEGEGLALTKHNYFSNKFDTTAWNDFDAIPRSVSNFGADDHGGSRKRLLFTRKQATCEGNEAKLAVAHSKMSMPNTRRMNLITNVAVENA